MRKVRKLLYVPAVILALIALPFDFVATLIYAAIEWLVDIAEEGEDA